MSPTTFIHLYMFVRHNKNALLCWWLLFIILSCIMARTSYIRKYYENICFVLDQPELYYPNLLKQQIAVIHVAPFVYSILIPRWSVFSHNDVWLVWADWGSSPKSTVQDTSTLNTSPPMRFLLHIAMYQISQFLRINRF